MMLQVIALGCLAALLVVWRLAHMATGRKRRDAEIAERLRRYARAGERPRRREHADAS